MATFYYYFSENMRQTGLDAPHELFGSLKQAKEVIAAALATKKMAHMTMGQLLSALGEVALPLGESAATKLALKRICTAYAAVSASYYLGACIGSAGVAMWKLSWPDAPMPTVQQLTDSDIQRILAEHRIEIVHQQRHQILTELHRHNAPDTAFGYTTAGSR